MSYVYNYDETATLIRALKLTNPHLKVGVFGGVFDLMHLGHIRALESCKKQCDFLIVLVMPDSVVREAKGDSRPILGESDRAMMVAESRYVDASIIGSRKKDADFMHGIVPDVVFLSNDHCKKVREYQNLFSSAKVSIITAERIMSTSGIIEEVLRKSSPRVISYNKPLSWEKAIALNKGAPARA